MFSLQRILLFTPFSGGCAWDGLGVYTWPMKQFAILPADPFLDR